jgi:hypothetical protein
MASRFVPVAARHGQRPSTCTYVSKRRVLSKIFFAIGISLRPNHIHQLVMGRAVLVFIPDPQARGFRRPGVRRQRELAYVA